MRSKSPTRSVAAFVVVSALALAACGSSSSTTKGASSSTDSVKVRLGYFPNVTHATAIVGVEKGLFAKALGKNKLEPKTFADGTAASEALNAGAIDATYIGSGPAINLFQKSGGKAIRIVSGATSGGASLVVKPSITSAKDLKGKTLSTPKLGNTQDVSLRSWLKKQGYTTTTTGGGDVKIAPQENSQTLDAFKAGTIDGAWVPEPWATRLVVEGGGKVLVDERDLFPNHQFVTTHLIVATKFLDAHPAVVKQLIEGQVAANAYINANAATSQTVVNAAIKKITGKDLKPEVIQRAWKNLEFTNDPIASSLQTAADAATAVKLLDSNDVKGIYDLSILNGILKAKGEPSVKGL
ncbi:MAG: ABC transporter substrate-binding protein [Actinomycetota bacterium]|nr:ABC transporter substrate-binding protein [Actinomycetota bacterium]